MKEGKEVESILYVHPRLSWKEVLEFYEEKMPEWGWEEAEAMSSHTFQRYFTKDGVPVLIGVDKQNKGTSFIILKGVSGDWGYMAPMREKAPGN
jgi:hypothetical protein